jgi:hypothetical protein
MSTVPPLQEYLRAFMKYSGAKPSEIQIKKYFNHAYVLYQGETYEVSRTEDLREDYRDYFERESFDEIYTQTHEGAFQCMLEEGDIEIEAGTFITKIYKRWRSYWDDKKDEIKRPEWYQELRRRSWEELQILLQAVSTDTKNAIKYASELEATEFLPIVILVIRDQYEDVDEFLDHAIEQLTAHGDAFLTMGDVFEVVYLGDEEDEDDCEEYYIYNPMIEFEDLNEEEQEKAN